ADLLAEAARKSLALDRFGDRGPRRRHPDTAARQFALEVGHHTVRPDHETDQIRNGLDLAADRAKPLRSGPAAARPGIEIGMLRLCQPRLVASPVTLAPRAALQRPRPEPVAERDPPR